MLLAGWCGTVSPGDLATSSARDLAANAWLLRRAARVALVARTVMPSAGGSSVPVDRDGPVGPVAGKPAEMGV